MRTKLDIIDELFGVIAALKDSNAGKDKVICDLAKDNVAKDNEIFNLKGRVEFLEKWARWNKGR